MRPRRASRCHAGLGTTRTVTGPPSNETLEAGDVFFRCIPLHPTVFTASLSVVFTRRRKALRSTASPRREAGACTA